ncbi:hypothetical protein PsorP6_007655 [Peronosclerospora sorghi]|uniref:Uncharacterized protein n=1 Tax=Peronosclerospora sorghi TaxID=230839 RepID=A0ACC0WBE6_9STRA|nr:hypothetical protein PsorP6_007655 [Peronosclerospora sorghi]
MELQATNIPFAIIKNGGGYPEAKKERQMEEILGDGVSIPSDRMCMSDTPMSALARQHGQDLVLAWENAAPTSAPS